LHNLWQPSPLSSPFPRERVRVRDGGFRGSPLMYLVGYALNEGKNLLREIILQNYKTRVLGYI